MTDTMWVEYHGKEFEINYEYSEEFNTCEFNWWTDEELTDKERKELEPKLIQRASDKYNEDYYDPAEWY